MMVDLQLGPCIVEMWVLDGTCPTRQAAHEQVKKIVHAGLAECIDDISLKGQGKRHLVFIARDVPYKANQIKHDVILQLVRKRLGEPMLTGTDVDRTLAPDGTLVLANGPIHVEIDTGSMGYREVMKRFAKYKECRDWVLWVSCGLWGSNDQIRMESLCGCSRDMAHCSWFCTLDEVKSKGWDSTIINWGREAVLNELLTKRPELSGPDEEATSEELQEVGS